MEKNIQKNIQKKIQKKKKIPDFFYVVKMEKNIKKNIQKKSRKKSKKYRHSDLESFLTLCQIFFWHFWTPLPDWEMAPIFNMTFLKANWCGLHASSTTKRLRWKLYRVQMHLFLLLAKKNPYNYSSCATYISTLGCGDFFSNMQTKCRKFKAKNFRRLCEKKLK